MTRSCPPLPACRRCIDDEAAGTASHCCADWMQFALLSQRWRMRDAYVSIPMRAGAWTRATHALDLCVHMRRTAAQDLLSDHPRCPMHCTALHYMMRSRFARDQHRLVLHMTHVSIQQRRRVPAVTTAFAEPSGLWIARWRHRRKQRAAVAGRYTAPAACTLIISRLLSLCDGKGCGAVPSEPT